MYSHFIKASIIWPLLIKCNYKTLLLLNTKPPYKGVLNIQCKVKYCILITVHVIILTTGAGLSRPVYLKEGHGL